MFRKSLCAGTMLFAVAACDMPTEDSSDGFTRVTDAATFEAAVVGRNLNNVNDQSTVFFRLNADGSMSGDIGRGALAGTWQFRDGYWCRTWKAGLKEASLNSEDCQLVELGTGQVALTRDRGAGNKGIYVIQSFNSAGHIGSFVSDRLGHDKALRWFFTNATLHQGAVIKAAFSTG